MKTIVVRVIGHNRDCYLRQSRNNGYSVCSCPRDAEWFDSKEQAEAVIDKIDNSLMLNCFEVVEVWT